MTGQSVHQHNRAIENRPGPSFSFIFYFLAVLALLIGFLYRNELSSGNEETKTIPVVTKYSLLEFFVNGSMNWNISTTPIPISAPSVILKSILSKNMEKIPSELRYLSVEDTVPINTVRQFINGQKYQQLISELCSGPNLEECKKWINQRDPEFGLTPLHLAYEAGHAETIQFLKSLGANPDIEDLAGRKPMNLSFRNFVANSRKFAKLAGRSDCDLPVVDVRSEEDFLNVKRLINEGEPVLIRNVLPWLNKGKDLLSFDLEQLVNQYGDSKVTVGEVPYADVFHLPHNISTLRDYYQQHVVTRSQAPLYIFQKNEGICATGLEALSDLVMTKFPSPNVICPVEHGNTGSESIHYFLGAKNSGAPLHIHADAINLVVSGEKRWFIYPPLDAPYSRKHIWRWLQEDYPVLEESKKPLECLQRAGDVAYIPFDWGHAVLNTADHTFGFALELLNRRTTMLSLPSLYQSC